MQTQQTAILIFANSAEKEALEKPFFKSRELFLELNRQVLLKVENSGIPYFWISEKEQIGRSFGERYINAIQSVFEKGYENVIAIGNDSPELQSKDLIAAKAKLDQDNIILGPSKDGGYYLLGIQKKHFNHNFFLSLAWQTSKLRNDLVSYFSSKKIKIAFLKSLDDIDSVPDIKNLIAGYKKINFKLKKLFLQILFTPRKIFKKYISVRSILISENFFNKGSPLSVF